MSHPGLARHSRNKYTNQYLNAAARLGLEFRQLEGGNQPWVISDGSRRFALKATRLGCNNQLAASISANKFLTYRRLAAGGFRVPDFQRLDTADFRSQSGLFSVALEWAGSRFPVVLKPTTGSGGTNVFAGIADAVELKYAIDQVWQQQPGELLLERHIAGNHYRINLLDGENINMAARYPAFVKGNGRDTIRELVEQKNAIKRQQGDAPIALGDRVIARLHRRGRSLDTVPNVGEHLVLASESNLYLGGDVERVPVDCVSAGLVRYFDSLYRYLGLRWLGLDLIVNDISSENAHQTCYINETSTAHPCHEYLPGETVEQHLALASLILQTLFDLPLTVRPWTLATGLPCLR